MGWREHEHGCEEKWDGGDMNMVVGKWDGGDMDMVVGKVG